MDLEYTTDLKRYVMPNAFLEHVTPYKLHVYS